MEYYVMENNYAIINNASPKFLGSNIMCTKCGKIENVNHGEHTSCSCGKRYDFDFQMCWNYENDVRTYTHENISLKKMYTISQYCYVYSHHNNVMFNLERIQLIMDKLNGGSK